MALNNGCPRGPVFRPFLGYRPFDIFWFKLKFAQSFDVFYDLYNDLHFLSMISNVLGYTASADQIMREEMNTLAKVNENASK